MRTLLLGQLAILIALAVWIARWPLRSVAGFAVQALGSLLGVLALERVGLWLFPPWWTPYAALGVIATAAAWHVWHAWNASRGKRVGVWPSGAVGWLGLALFASLGAYGGAMLWQLRGAGRPPATPAAIALASPLAAGRYLAANGGSALAVNAHRASMDTTIERLRPWRGNGHGVDLVAINAFGLRGRGVFPHDPAHYRIFDVPVLAPCSGTVLVAVDGLRDLSPPEFDREHPAGNHVLLDCGEAHVVLAHFKQGSVRVAVGDRVSTGAVIGAVGNSGGSDEPHLHIHAQRPGPPGAPYAGDPLPILLWGRHLVRGDRVTVP